MADTAENRLKAIDGDDWKEAFAYAKDFKREDAQSIIACAEGENDGDSWVGVFILKDGRFAYLKAWCDYTGWDCQAGGESATRPTLAALVVEECEEDDRKRLGLSVQGSFGYRTVVRGGEAL